MSAAPSPIQPAVGGMTDERRNFETWHSGKYGNALTAWVEDKGRFAWDLTQELWLTWQAALASTSPAQTGEPDAWQDPDCPRHVISKEDKRDFTDPAINGAVSRMNAERCTRPLFATRQTGGVDQAWVDRAKRLFREAGPIHDDGPFLAHLSTALGAGNANSDSVHLTPVSDKAPTVSENKEFQCK